MKILIADFEINPYGGIIEHVEAKARAIKSLGHQVDIAQLSISSTTEAAYARDLKELEGGEWAANLKINSQNGGYEKSEATGYWKNNYYGYLLPPSNRIGVYDPRALEKWNNLVSDVDLIMWNFMPTKNKAMNKGNLDFWWKFYDLPSSIAQIFIVHDAYFDIRGGQVSALKEKILFLECAHIGAYQCCENIGIPRTLLLNPRFIEDDAKMPIVSMKDREVDFFAAHIFKSMKHVDDYIRAIPYIGNKYINWVAGSGIEQNYMVSKEKIKPCYICSTKKDPDLPKKLDGKISVWDRAVEHGMEYLGQIESVLVNEILTNAKFAIDPSWCTHYAKFCRTHINGFIIEAMFRGCYPVLIDYNGLQKDKNKIPDDPLFDNIKAIIIPWSATPKEFAEALKRAVEEITPEKYLEDTKHNYDLVCSLFNAKENMKEVIRLIKGGRKLINRELECGEDSETVKKVVNEIMIDFYKIKLPIDWTTK